jgi:cell wall-associated NlpC family hydrolase
MRASRLALIASLVLAAGAPRGGAAEPAAGGNAAREVPVGRTRATRSPPEQRARVVTIARSYVGKRFHGDCSAFVTRVFRRADVPLRRSPGVHRSGTEAIFSALTRVSKPRPGDVVVFHRTYDREAPGPGRNLFTHVAIVESVRGANVTFIHRSGRVVRRSTMNLDRPRDPHANDVVRRRRPSDAPGQRYLAGELVAGFASPLAAEPRQARRAP